MGYRVTNCEGERMNDDEWRDAVRHSTEAELKAAQDSYRASLGIVGDRGDDQ
jgi:hypothetical protein